MKIAELLGLQTVAHLGNIAKEPQAHRLSADRHAPSKVTAHGPFLTIPEYDGEVCPHKKGIASAPETRMAIYQEFNVEFEFSPVAIVRARLPLQFGRGFLRYYILWVADEAKFLDSLDYEELEFFRAENPLAARRFVEAELDETGGQVEDRLPPEVKMVRIIGSNKRLPSSGRAKNIGHPIKMADPAHSVHAYPCRHCGYPTTRRAYSHRYGRREGFYCSESCQLGKG